MKTVEAQGYSKEKALEATGLDVQLEMLKNATQAWKKAGSPMNTKELNRFMAEYIKKNKLFIIHPFYKYIHWNENELEHILFNELSWKSPKGSQQTSRIGCEVDTLRQYLFYRTLGYNDTNVDISVLIREGHYSREEGFKKLGVGLDIPEDYIVYILTKAGIDAKSFLKKLDKKYPLKRSKN